MEVRITCWRWACCFLSLRYFFCATYTCTRSRQYAVDIREVLIRDSEEHVSLRAVALGIPARVLLIRGSEEVLFLRDIHLHQE